MFVSHPRRAVARRRSCTKASYIAGRRSSRCHGAMTNVRLIKHEVIPNCGSYEVRYSDGRPSRYFYWDDMPSRRLDPRTLTGEQALELAKAAAHP